MGDGHVYYMVRIPFIDNLIYIQLSVFGVCVLQNGAGKHAFYGVDEVGQSGNQHRELNPLSCS